MEIAVSGSAGIFRMVLLDPEPGLFKSDNAAVLSPRIGALISTDVVALDKSASSFLSHSAFFAAAQAAIYSASQIEAAVVFCRSEVHRIAPLLSRNTDPEVDRLRSGSPARSESLHPKTGAHSGPYLMPRLVVPRKYRSTRLATAQCSCVGLDTQRDSTPTTNAISGLVQLGKHKRLPKTSLYGWSVTHSSSF
jgi:hypothetical protein